jgi:hypothetical protein
MARTKRAEGYLPGQHGAWAMLIIPFVLGMAAAGPAWLHAPLFAAWLLIYLFSYPFLQAIKTRKWKVYAKPVQLYGALLLPFATLAAILEPRLIRWVPLFIPLFAVNAWFARRKQERAFVNDLAAVVQFSLATFVAYDAGGGTDWKLAAELFALSVLYFTGTVFYVKTIIRERGNLRFYAYSIIYHIALLATGVFWFPCLLLVPFAVLLVRAVVSPRMRPNVKVTGILEIVYSVVLAVFALMAYAA